VRWKGTISSTREEQKALERLLKYKDKSLYEIGLFCGVSESSMYKYRNGKPLSFEIKKKIDDYILILDKTYSIL